VNGTIRATGRFSLGTEQTYRQKDAGDFDPLARIVAA
jgi:hypothetical protein